MPQGVPHNLIRNIVIYHGTGQRRSKCVGAAFASARYDTGRTNGGRCQFPQKMHRDMGERWLQAEKNVFAVTGGPFMLKIIQKRRLDFRQHGQRQWSSGFLLCQADRFPFEIQFLKTSGWQCRRLESPNGSPAAVRRNLASRVALPCPLPPRSAGSLLPNIPGAWAGAV